MSTRTITDLARAVMEDLGLLAAGETLAQTDWDYVNRRYREGLEELRDDGLVWWEANAIPFVVFPGVVGYVSVLVSEGFGIPRTIPMDTDIEAAKRRIRRRVAKASTGEQTSFTDY
jgi:hypothetical protein